ncbi:MAG: hypothetical protein HY245_15325 [Rhizobiales bacterium]|nr:hypothetical protein [Hyphomicrobiales bacterium]MBI3674758.1 hypothetical protein [Hyphomicrobiales bacterium]
MLKLAPSRPEPYWLDLLSGVRIKVRPATVAAIIGARAAAAEAMKAQGADVSLGSAAFTRSLARWGIVAWEGIGDADGKPVDVSPDNIDALLEVWQAFDAIDRLYVTPALIGVQEKNA